MPRLSPTLNIMFKAAEKAARSLIRDFGEVEQLQVSQKGPGDFVSAADTRAESIIREELAKARPDYSFLMEESGKHEGQDTDHVWIVDPLDGTSNFLHGIPHWCISIALEQKGKIISALVHDPVKDEVFYAEKNTGAFMRNKRLRVSGRNDPKSALVSMGSHIKDGEVLEKQLSEYGAVCHEIPLIRRYGAAALDLAYVAAGRFDGFWEKGLKPWDVAAGYLITLEAGGFVTSLDYRDNPVYSDNVIAGNQAIHAKLKDIVEQANA